MGDADAIRVGRSLAVDVATSLVAAVLVPAGWLVWIGVRLMGDDSDFLLLVMPIIGICLLGIGLFVTMMAGRIAVELIRREPRARLHTIGFGMLLAFSGAWMVIATGDLLWPWALSIVAGTALVGLMAMPSAAEELGPLMG